MGLGRVKFFFSVTNCDGAAGWTADHKLMIQVPVDEIADGSQCYPPLDTVSGRRRRNVVAAVEEHRRRNPADIKPIETYILNKQAREYIQVTRTVKR